MPHETAAVLAQVLCTPYNHAPCCFMQSHIRKVYAFSCNLPPALLAEWPGSFTCYCGNMGVEQIPKIRVSTESQLWKKTIIPPLQQGFKPVTFQSRVWCSNHWAIPACQNLEELNDSLILSSSLNQELRELFSSSKPMLLVLSLCRFVSLCLAFLVCSIHTMTKKVKIPYIYIYVKLHVAPAM